VQSSAGNELVDACRNPFDVGPDRPVRAERLGERSHTVVQSGGPHAELFDTCEVDRVRGDDELERDEEP
jgi:hypothetical protein